MADHIDERWEYWTPDPEIAEVMGTGRSAGFGGLPRSKCSTTGELVAAGFRFGTGTPDFDLTRHAPPRWERPDRLPLRRCGSCPRVFTPTRREHRYCSNGCVPRVGPPRVSADRVCRHAPCSRVFRPGSGDQQYCGRACFAEVRVTCVPVPCAGCGRTFKPAQHGRRACSKKCGGVLIRAVKVGKPACHDWDRMAALFAGGMSLTDVARESGACREAVRHALRSRGVYVAARPGRKRVLPDRECLNPACGVVFRPRQDSHRFCCKPCDYATRPGRAAATITPE